MSTPIIAATPDPTDHAARARVFLDNIHDRLRGGTGPELRTAEQKDLMATEALAHAVLALNDTLNRIFPDQPSVDSAEHRPDPIDHRGSRLSVDVSADGQDLATRVLDDPAQYAAKPEDQLPESVIADMINAARPLAQRAGASHAMVTTITSSGIQEVAIRFEPDGRSATLHVDPTPDPRFAQAAADQGTD